ncbi:50S ribosomal protein L37ae [Patescibacteria group bacterium]|nr:50S ribosomal protein L37ae [Patescibacteria group bacterium]
MAKKGRLGGAKTWGARYGRNLREKVAAIRAITKSKSKCPYCAYFTVKRQAVGIFYCSKCDAKFAGKAYAPAKTITLRAKIATEAAVEAEEEAKE